MIQWAFYELHIHPRVTHTLKGELDFVFGPDTHPSAIANVLQKPDAGVRLTKLSYTDAVIKETLRLHPPGTKARVAPIGLNTTLALPDGDMLCIGSLCINQRAYTIQRHPKLFGDSRNDFSPSAG